MEKIVESLNSFLGFAYDNILSIAMMVLLIATGVFLSIRTGFFQFRKFGYVLKNTAGMMFNKKLHHRDAGSVSPFQAVTTALAGTIGTGSIAGVATALVLGGPGAVFWMWIAAFFGMMTNYAENVLGLQKIDTAQMEYIELESTNVINVVAKEDKGVLVGFLKTKNVEKHNFANS